MTGGGKYMLLKYKRWGFLSRLVCVFVVGTIISVSAYAAPAKVETKTVAAKAPPAGAVGANAVKKAKQTVKKTAPKTAATKVVKNPPQKNVSDSIKKESVVGKFASHLKQKDKNSQKKKKPVKMRKQVIDGKVCMWGRTAEDSELCASEAVRKFVGKKGDFQYKDSVITADGGKFYCMLRFNYSDQIPETWYLETEMVTGFGKNKLRAFADAVSRARSRVKSIHSSADWVSSNSSVKNAGEMGFIPYDFVFAKAGNTTYCKVFFRYLKQR